MEVGTLVWLHQADDWIPSTVISKTTEGEGGSCLVTFEDSSGHTVVHR